MDNRNINPPNPNQADNDLEFRRFVFKLVNFMGSGVVTAMNIVAVVVCLDQILTKGIDQNSDGVIDLNELKVPGLLVGTTFATGYYGYRWATSGLALLREARAHSNAEHAYNNVDEKSINEANELDAAFEALSENEKITLVNQGLAEEDVAKNITLKFTCSLSHALMCNPVVLEVKNVDGTIAQDIYDEKFITGYLRLNLSTTHSPKTMRPLVDNVVKPVADDMQIEFKNYKSNLKKAIEQIVASRNENQNQPEGMELGIKKNL